MPATRPCWKEANRGFFNSFGAILAIIYGLVLSDMLKALILILITDLPGQWFYFLAFTILTLSIVASAVDILAQQENGNLWLMKPTKSATFLLASIWISQYACHYYLTVAVGISLDPDRGIDREFLDRSMFLHTFLYSSLILIWTALDMALPGPANGKKYLIKGRGAVLFLSANITFSAAGAFFYWELVPDCSLVGPWLSYINDNLRWPVILVSLHGTYRLVVFLTDLYALSQGRN